MKKVLILAAEGFEDSELIYPYYRMQEAGFGVSIAGIGEKTYKGKSGVQINCDGDIEDFNPKDFAALIIPGGWAPDKLRRSKTVLDFVKELQKQDKIIAAICHGPQVLISAGVLKNRTLTCVAAIKDDVTNAGAKYLDKSVVVDRNLITSRYPADLPHFCREIVKALK